MIGMKLIATTWVAAGVLALTAPAFAAPQLQRVRGTIEAATDNSLTIKTQDGKTQTIVLKPDTKFLSVVKSSLDNVTDGKFIGTATKGENPPVALEVVIFPPALKGTGEGHYDWDSIHDTTAGGGAGGMTKSSMTNGTVKSGASAGGGKKISVTYDNGQSLDVSVPPSAPIVEFEVADKSIVKPGATVFTNNAKDGDKLDAKVVAVGKDGVTPPM